ncbi:MAG: alcohol dehydrogenase catalytic domain-containing protein [Candidatus Lokiarchaeota archaeon]|nr:alcohol dehydrogenase catalytic domain-containing protein [Candidatus Lokiarchaeota archaeon]
MKGIIFEEPRKVVLKKDIEKPKVKSDEVLIKIHNCGICGSDIESYNTGALELTGIILGHEFSGEIVELGKNVKKMDIGTRVTANPNKPCGKCYWCVHNQENMCKKTSGIGQTHNGALAEYIKVKADRIHILPDKVSYSEGAMVEPLAVSLYAASESGFTIGNSSVVIGAGAIGLMTIQVLRAAGASQLIVLEPVESKQKKALELGADIVLDPKSWRKINKLTKKIGPDYVFDCVGIPETINNSMKIVKKGGYIVFIGIHVEPFEIQGFLQLLMKNITIRGTYAYDQDIFQAAIRLINQKKVDVNSLITKKIKLEDVPKEFESLSKLKHEEIKVMTEI